MKTSILFLALSLPLLAQIPAPSSQQPQGGSGGSLALLPQAGLTSAIPATCGPGQLYFATDATAGQNIYECASTNTWTQQLNSGSGGAPTPLELTDAAPGATPSYNMTNGCTGSAPCAFLYVTLSANVTSWTLTFSQHGAPAFIQICQPGAGGPYTMPASNQGWPSNVTGGPEITTIAGKCTWARGNYDDNSGALIVAGTGTTDFAQAGPEVAAPGAAPTRTGVEYTWVDSTRHAPMSWAHGQANPFGQVQDLANVSHSWFSSLVNGILTATQPAFTDISGTASAGQIPNPSVTVTTGASATLSTPYTYNQEATAAQAVAYTLPTASAGAQYCVDNSYNGSNPNTGALTVNASASGQYIIYTDGTLSASGGYVLSGGAARDGACFAGIDATHWMFYPHSPTGGSWAKH